MLVSGTRIDGRYEILTAIGSGGMGHVYRAHRFQLGDEVAIKVMQGAHDAPRDVRERFLRESRSCAQLRHPNIVGILDFGFDGSSQPFLVMELLSGPSLREEIAVEAPMRPTRVAEIITPIASALQLAHDRGITHRDIKPANVVAHRYDSGERVYKLIDFGLASIKAASDQTRLTTPALFLGTMAYAAPEQLRGDEVTPATDIYALGVLTYEMLTGTRPFDDGNHLSFVNQSLTVRPDSASKRRPGLSVAVDGAVMRALAKAPEERWPSAVAFAEALAAAAGTGTGGGVTGDGGLLARYELGACIGSGRSGSQVYRATHRALGVPVAIRVLKREGQPNWDIVRARFLLEARTLQLAHPGVLQVRDFGEDERSVFLVTDFVDGPSLRQVLAETGPLAWPRAAALLRQALDAVAAVHHKGGFIAGVNPDMIRLSTDEGRERIVMSTAGISSVQDVLATMREQELRGQEASEQELPYIAPEVLMGRAPNVRADVFTLGVLAYLMATEQLPFRAPSLPELLGQMLNSVPVAPATLNPAVPLVASAAILKCLAADPMQRFASATELAATTFADRRRS